MKALRSFLMVISFSIFGIGSLLVGMLIFPLIRLFIKNQDKRMDIYSSVVHSSWRVFVNFIRFIKIIKLDIDNIEKLKTIKNSIIVSTHPSYIDVLILLALIPKTTCFVAPKLTRNKFFKRIVESMFLISGKSLEELKEDTKKMFDYGFNILIFPAGIRHRKNEYPKIHKGAALTAINSKKDIVPVIMSTDFDFLQIGQPFYDAGEKPVVYTIRAGKIIEIEKFMEYQDEVLQKRDLTNEIKKALYEL